MFSSVLGSGTGKCGYWEHLQNWQTRGFVLFCCSSQESKKFILFKFLARGCISLLNHFTSKASDSIHTSPTGKLNWKLIKTETYVQSYSYHQCSDKTSGTVLLFSQDIGQHSDPSVGTLRLGMGSTCPVKSRKWWLTTSRLLIGAPYFPMCFIIESKLILSLMVMVGQWECLSESY